MTNAFYLPPIWIERLRPWLENPSVTKVCHNAKFEYQVLKTMGIVLRGFEDTKIAAYLLGFPSTHLKDLSGTLLGIRQQRYEEWDKESPDYPAADAACTLHIWRILSEQLREEGLWDVYRNIELPLVPVLADMEREGVKIDVERLAKVKEHVSSQLVALAHRVPQVDNLGSSDQIATYLYGTLGLIPPHSTPGGKDSVDKAALSALDHPTAKIIMEWKGLKKLRDGYLDTLPDLVAEDGRVHGSFNQAGTWDEEEEEQKESPSTGRLSSSHPNLQNIPRRSNVGRQIRACFVAEEGCVLVRGDVGQEEARIAALLTNDKRLLERFHHDEDVYIPVGEMVKALCRKPPSWSPKEWRELAKVVFLAELYGARETKLQEVCGKAGARITPLAAALLDTAFSSEYSGIADYAEVTTETLQRQGWVSTWFGRKRWIPKVYGGNARQKEEAYREAANMPVQGTAADVMKMMLVRVAEGVKGIGRLILTVHDEVVVECEEKYVEKVREVLLSSTEGLLPVKLPVEVTMGKSWAI